MSGNVFIKKTILPLFLTEQGKNAGKTSILC